MHIHLRACLGDAQASCLEQRKAHGLGVHGSTTESLKQPSFTTDSKGTAIQKPGNDAKTFELSQVVRKK